MCLPHHLSIYFCFCFFKSLFICLKKYCRDQLAPACLPSSLLLCLGCKNKIYRNRNFRERTFRKSKESSVGERRIFYLFVKPSESSAFQYNRATFTYLWKMKSPQRHLSLVSRRVTIVFSVQQENKMSLR